MPEQPNFLLGYGERLTEPIAPPSREMKKREPYGFNEARDRLVPMVHSVSEALDSLPERACPRDEAVAVLTLHPEYLAKSFYPGSLLRGVGLEAVGSRPRRVKPEKWTKKGKPEPAETTELFIAGPRQLFRRWAEALSQWRPDTPGAEDLAKVERFRAFSRDDRLRSIPEESDALLLETALHSGLGGEVDYILDAFSRYLQELNVEPDLERRITAGGLLFLPVRARREALNGLAEFSFLRIARPMPSLRPLNPVVRSWSGPPSFDCELPDEPPVDPGLRVAVLDGGLPEPTALGAWAINRDVPGVGSAAEPYLVHGASVTSAVLFGPLREGVDLERPYAAVEHFRVLDETSGRDQDLYDVLLRIQQVLQAGEHQFVNLSIGPETPVDDEEVHAWTAVLDDYLSAGNVLTTIAAGNGGERDATLGFNRVQVPADCVNALTIGAADVSGDGWNRAAYSSVGPGRSPGLVKPDCLAFGGSEREPFWVVDPQGASQTLHVAGTSFASPAALRMGLGVRAHFGDLLSPLAIKALLVHCSDRGGAGRHEAGWGRIPQELEEFVICPEGTARVVYQGQLEPGQYMRARIPIPEEELAGKVAIRATFCYATGVDPDHPGNYTRSGLDVVFRPHDKKFDPNSDNPEHPVSDPFFQLKEFSTEHELRRDAHKWETTLHREKNKYGSSLRNPVFDIHYNAREASAPTRRRGRIRYALVITVISPRTGDLYNRIVQRYPTQLRPLVPVVQIPIRL